MFSPLCRQWVKAKGGPTRFRVWGLTGRLGFFGILVSRALLVFFLILLL